MVVEDMDKLEEKATTLFDRRDNLSKEIELNRHERDRLNELVKTIQEKAKKEREERDAINEKVANLKKRLARLRSRLAEKLTELGSLDEELKGSRRQLRSRRHIEDELRTIEWRLSTTPTLEIKDEESILVDRANALRAEIKKHEGLDSKDDIYIMSLADTKAIELEIKNTLNEMNRLHLESEQHHERMITLYGQADEERKKADEAHKRFVEDINSVKDVYIELDRIMIALKERRTIEKQKNRAMEARRTKQMEEIKKEMKAEALRKLEAGEKLTLEEMKLIYGEE